MLGNENDSRVEEVRKTWKTSNILELVMTLKAKILFTSSKKYCKN